ncbi:MAG: hypothetical protein ACJ8BW_35370, partial [Ktedonobacteraceae bacterium]
MLTIKYLTRILSKREAEQDDAILLRLRLEPVNAHRFELAVHRRVGARRVALDRELSTNRTGMPARNCICQRSHSHSLECGPTQSRYQRNGREETPYL